MSESFPLVSVIIPSYNHEKYIEEAIRSVWEQTYQNIELIVLDDGSKDHSPDIIKNLEKISPIPMKVIIKKNDGLCITLNQGLALAKGEYVSFLASDDKFLPQKIKLLIQYYVDNEDPLGIVYGDGYLIDNDGNRYRKLSENKKFRSGHIYEDLLLFKFMIPYVTTLYRTSVLREVGGFDETLVFEDWDLFLNISRKYSCLYVDEVVGEYRQHLGERLNQNVAKIVPDLMKIFERNMFLYARSKEHFWKRKAYASLYKSIGQLYYNKREFPEARKWLMKALWMNVCHFPAYNLLLRSFFGKTFITKLSTFKERLKR